MLPAPPLRPARALAFFDLGADTSTSSVICDGLRRSGERSARWGSARPSGWNRAANVDGLKEPDHAVGGLDALLQPVDHLV